MKTREELLNEMNKFRRTLTSGQSKVLKSGLHQILSAPTEDQLKCDYCHAPFLDLSGKTEDEFDQFDPDGAYCGLDKDSMITYGSPGDGFDGQDRNTKINYCPMCGRKLGDERNAQKS
jgi:hypothetical protein